MTEQFDQSRQAPSSGWRIGFGSAAAFLVLVPLVAMRFSDQVNWSLADFVVFAALLLGVGAAFEVAIRITPNRAYRSAVGLALAATFLLIWVNGAVGIIGSASNDANLMFAALLVVGLTGAIFAGLRAHGLARTLLAMAFTQLVIAVIALIAGSGRGGSAWPWDLILSTGFFTAMWLISARLFQRAAQQNRAKPQ